MPQIHRGKFASPAISSYHCTSNLKPMPMKAAMLLFGMLFSIPAASQRPLIRFSYDAAGNRIKREYDTDGNVRYVGITSRDPQLRFTEHLKSGTNRSTLNFETVKIDMFGEMNARFWEQNQINQLGLQKNGGHLFNKINSIAPKNWNKFNIKY